MIYMIHNLDERTLKRVYDTVTWYNHTLIATENNDGQSVCKTSVSIWEKRTVRLTASRSKRHIDSHCESKENNAYLQQWDMVQP